MAVCAGAIDSVFCWGFNGWGELGLGDLSIRLQPTKVSALKHMKVRQVVAGERHSLVVLRHQVLCARDLPVLQPFFQVRLRVYDGLSSSSFDGRVWTPTERKILITLPCTREPTIELANESIDEATEESTNTLSLLLTGVVSASSE